MDVNKLKVGDMLTYIGNFDTLTSLYTKNKQYRVLTIVYHIDMDTNSGVRMAWGFAAFLPSHKAWMLSSSKKGKPSWM